MFGNGRGIRYNETVFEPARRNGVLAPIKENLVEKDDLNKSLADRLKQRAAGKAEEGGDAAKQTARDRLSAALGNQGSDKASKAEKAPAKPAPAAKAAAAAKTYTVAAGDSLSAIAQKQYGSATRDKWMAIYEANKALIGDNPSLIRPGQVLTIPDLD